MKIDKYLSHLPPHLANRVQNSLDQGITSIIKLGLPIRSIVLGGGWKNREVRYASQEIDGDLDLFVFSNWLPLFWNKIQRLNARLDKIISNPRVHYRGVMPILLPRSRTFWAYKLKYEGIPLWGRPDFLERIQASSDNISPVEAIRVLFQTLVGWLMFFEVRYPHQNPTTIIQRAYLSMGDACLVFAGNLAPSYTERAGRFAKVAYSCDLEPELANRIKRGYETKTTKSPGRPPAATGLPTMNQAQQDCLRLASVLISRYLRSEQPLHQQLHTIGKNLRPHRIFNILFYIRLKNVGLSPKFFPLLQIKATDLYQMANYLLSDHQTQYEQLVQKFFGGSGFNKATLVTLFELWPLPSTTEL